MHPSQDLLFPFLSNPLVGALLPDAHFMIVHLKGKMYEQETGLNYRKLNEICTDGWNKLGCDVFQNLVDHLHMYQFSSFLFKNMETHPHTSR